MPSGPMRIAPVGAGGRAVGRYLHLDRDDRARPARRMSPGDGSVLVPGFCTERGVRGELSGPVDERGVGQR
jgi:hypothetical protein